MTTVNDTDATGSAVPPKQVFPNIHNVGLRFMRDRAAAIVMVAFTLIVIAIVLVLQFEIQRIESQAKTPTFDTAIDLLERKIVMSADKNFEFHVRAALESDAQYLRSMRAQSALSARLMVQVVAEIVALSLIVLGGTLVYARISSQADTSQTNVQGAGFAVRINSTYPGVFLCLAGAAVCAWTLQITVDDNARISTRDGAIYISGYTPENKSEEVPPRSKEDCELISMNLPGCEIYREK